MDIVAERLSADTLRAHNVTVRGQDVLAWFESKLSSSVSFAGVFESLDDAPRRNGAVAIVGSKDYIYSSTTSAWQEFGDEGQTGALAQSVQALSDELFYYAKKDEISSVSAVSQLLNDVGYLSAEADPVFQALSSSFLTAHQDLSGYYRKTETSSAGEISTALCAIVSAKDFSTALSGKTYQYDDGIVWMANALIDIISVMGGVVKNFPG